MCRGTGRKPAKVDTCENPHDAEMSNILNTKDHIITPTRKYDVQQRILEELRGVWSNTVLSLRYIFSIESKDKEKPES